MAKLIPDLKNQILNAARQLLLAEGYQALSMRALAKQCGIAVGTLYNYYPGKDALISHITLEDWHAMLLRMEQYTAEPRPLAEGMTGLCRLLEEFTARYRGIWQQVGGTSRVSGYLARYHASLREQLAAPLEQLMRRGGREELVPLCLVLAEAMLAAALYPELGAERFGLLASLWTPQDTQPSPSSGAAQRSGNEVDDHEQL